MIFVCVLGLDECVIIYLLSHSKLSLNGFSWLGNALMWSQLTSRSDLLNNSVSSTQLMPLKRTVCESLPTKYHCRILYLSPRRCNTYNVLSCIVYIYIIARASLPTSYHRHVSYLPKRCFNTVIYITQVCRS